ncbi:hypothetical protein ADUPG1_005545, partial [Aduncisulcus paluster]
MNYGHHFAALGGSTPHYIDHYSSISTISISPCQSSCSDDIRTPDHTKISYESSHVSKTDSIPAFHGEHQKQ